MVVVRVGGGGLVSETATRRMAWARVVWHSSVQGAER